MECKLISYVSEQYKSRQILWKLLVNVVQKADERHTLERKAQGLGHLRQLVIRALLHSLVHLRFFFANLLTL